MDPPSLGCTDPWEPDRRSVGVIWAPPAPRGALACWTFDGKRERESGSPANTYPEGLTFCPRSQWNRPLLYGRAALGTARQGQRRHPPNLTNRRELSVPLLDGPIGLYLVSAFSLQTRGDFERATGTVGAGPAGRALLRKETPTSAKASGHAGAFRRNMARKSSQRPSICFEEANRQAQAAMAATIS